MNLKTEEIIPTVLIVDDNPNNVKIIALTLRPLSYKLVIATNGKSAIEMVDKTRPDLVLLDVMMPEMDGYETCRIIKSKSENENLPVVFLTALSDKENTVMGFDAGGVDYITKPFNKNELISRVKTHLELKRTQDKLRKTMEHLSELNGLKDKMFSVIGHDLRSPLGSVKMTLEFLSQTSDAAAGEELKSTLDLLVKTTDEVFSLLENLLGWARSQSGNLSLEKEAVDLNDLVNSVYLLNKGNLNLKGINFITEIAPDTKVNADLNTLKIVFRNILSNAIKFTPEKGKITISASESDGRIKVDIKDSGVGIPEESISKLFDQTQHLTTYGTNRESGSGLGLILCKDFVERNDGTIQVESEVGKGTTFSLFLSEA
ncbi:hybrid sensor histidine kinase/response regulator [Maribellus maritimus]|uniref:hybrid sensor histidine kinase/response regulator n=1 Tax=Maribellus maritimus TaxID=2870838 RepID=UPI001EEBED8A|nr:hybrid sensor histidine kinase/response regulator [Maribellus maritimus]MCG6186901.1 hybrid sensor histidine kinase/response regulator [Maribellus maritimus]